MSKPSNNQAALQFWLWGVVLMTFVLVAVLESLRVRTAIAAGLDWSVCLIFWDIETTIPFLLLIAFPFIFWAGKRNQRAGSDVESSDGVEQTKAIRLGKNAFICGGLLLLTLASSYRIGSWPVDLNFAGETRKVAFADLPPTYHDEFSYLLQANTFRKGRLSYPPAKIRPDLFHQFHVLNERRTVSRYFPFTGAWIAAATMFVQPIHGHWIAGGLATVFLYLSLLRIVSPSVALIAGILIAVSPGIAIFSNLLLAHHPTLLALSIFTYCFLRMDETLKLGTPKSGWAFAAGMALTLAMLSRPMTAAGYALPYGILLLYRFVLDSRSRILAIGFAVPICLGFVTLGLQNHDATGSVFGSAYQSYTDTFTPKHRFGFNNAVGTAEPEGPDALRAYNDWASNLTPASAVQNVWGRLKASVQWSLASIPILFGICMALPLLVWSTSSGQVKTVCYFRLMAWSIVTLHLVHVPYWFDGILHWHYVFETAPLLLIVTAVGLCSAASVLRKQVGRIGVAWVVALALAGLVPGWIQLPMFQNVSRISAAISEQAYSRTRMQFFRQLLSTSDLKRPALVLVDESGTDPQLSYIINPPDYKAEILTCRRPSSEAEILELQQAFVDRTLYIFNPSKFQLKLWAGSADDGLGKPDSGSDTP